jgi:hypothetical protein
MRSGKNINELLNGDFGSSFEKMATWWPSDKKFWLRNMLPAAVLWCLRKVRNNLCFQGGCSMSLKNIWLGIWRLLRNWKVVCSSENCLEVNVVVLGWKSGCFFSCYVLSIAQEKLCPGC